MTIPTERFNDVALEERDERRTGGVEDCGETRDSKAPQ